MQIQCTKNLNPERSELGTTLRQPNWSVGGAPNDGFLHALKILFKLSRVLLDL